jgi:lipoprotein NlpI
LVGQLPEGEFIAAATDDPATSRATYYLGLEADARGNIAEAIIWYRACIQANEEHLVEHRVAKRRLLEIHRSQLPLAALGTRP